MAVPVPPSPVLLYLGAGYDLSPLLSFAPSPPYTIAPLTAKTTYTSFLFADAKPRHTSAFMVSDFDEWLDAPSRVRNILRYAQGMLNRWRIIDDDLIVFEGGGSAAHIGMRTADPAWHGQPHPHSYPNPHPSAHQPLTTLYYAFNTLDIELSRLSALAPIFPHIAALYVHGLRPYPMTGLKLSALEHVYVIVGSWGTPKKGGVRAAGEQRGVRHVDFVSAARKRWREAHKHQHHDQHIHDEEHDSEQLPDERLQRHTPHPQPILPPRPAPLMLLSNSSSSVDSEATSPLIFRRPAPWWDTDAESWSGDDSEDDEDEDMDGVAAAEDGLRTVRDGMRVRTVRVVDREEGEDMGLTPGLTTSSTVDSRWPLSGRYDGFAQSSTSPSNCNPNCTSTSTAASTLTCSSPARPSRPRFDTAFAPRTRSAPSAPTSLPRSSTSPSSSALRSSSTTSHSPPFYTRIPQVSWDDTLHGGRGGYFVAKTVAESLEVWRARGATNAKIGLGALETESEESAEDDDKAEDDIVGQDKGVPRDVPNFRSRTAPPRLRLRPRSPALHHPLSPSPSSASSTTDVDSSHTHSHDRGPLPFWRRPRSALFQKTTPSRDKERRIGMVDFLRTPPGSAPLGRAAMPERESTPYTTSSTPYTASSTPSRPYIHPHARSHSCPDLKALSSPSSSDFPQTRARRSFFGGGGFRFGGAKGGAVESKRARRARAGRERCTQMQAEKRVKQHSNPPPPLPLPHKQPTSASKLHCTSTPPSNHIRAASTSRLRHAHTPNLKQKRYKPLDDMDWHRLGRLLGAGISGKGGRRSADRDSCESDVTRVEC